LAFLAFLIAGAVYILFRCRIRQEKDLLRITQVGG
jgi:hypothetical protein